MTIYVDGLERSGNTYLCYAISLSTGVEVISSRQHNLYALKNHTGPELFIVPLRDAFPSMVSAKIYRDHVLLNSEPITEDNGNLLSQEDLATTELIIQRYKEYIEYLVDNEQFIIAPFHEFIKDHNTLINILIKADPTITKIAKLTADQVMLYLKEENLISDDPYTGHLPRQTVAEKESIQQLFMDKHASEIEEIQAKIDILYQRYEGYKTNGYVRQ